MVVDRRRRSDPPQPSPSPRPDLPTSPSGRPAVRISRLRPLNQHGSRLSSYSTTPVTPAAEPAHLADSQPITRLRSPSEPTCSPDRDDRTHTPRPPFELVRDARGQPVVIPMPPQVVVHPDPHNTVPIPSSSAHPETLAATTGLDENGPTSGQEHTSGLWHWLSTRGRRRNRDSDIESGREKLEGSPNSRDYSLSEGRESGQYADDVVDWLDVIDPQVSTVSTLSNVQNSLFVPDIGLINRMPLISLHRSCEECDARSASRAAARTPGVPPADIPSPIDEREEEGPEIGEMVRGRDTLPKKKRVLRRAHIPKPLTEGVEPKSRSPSPSSVSSLGVPSTSSSSSEAEMRRRERIMQSTETIRGEYAVLPAGIAWDDWTEEEREELDDYVRHLLHSRRERIRRRFRGFLQFVSRPLGAFITIYAFLITFWGAAWVLFLIGWIYVGDRKAYFVEICEQVLTALFCLVGIGMSPFRAVDTYHMIYIVHYHHLTLKLRKAHNLPKLTDKNDLPNPDSLDPDLEAQFKKDEEPVLTPEQQAKLVYHQQKYHNSHTFYRPHETPTHRAFPLSLLIAITVLLDCHSLLQMALGATTWGINYHVRPPELTAIILSFSISCNITAGILISVGGRKTRKVEEVEKRLRQALTEEAMRNLGKGKRSGAAKAKNGRSENGKASEVDQGALDKVKNKVDELKERHLERRTSEDSQGDPLDDRRARWKARVEASNGRAPSSHTRRPSQTPATSGRATPLSNLSRATSEAKVQI